MKVNGRIIKCMGKEPSLGLMVENMLVSILKIKNKVMESSFGLMEDLTKETGIMVSNMEKEFMLQVKALKNTENGKKEKGLDGLERLMEMIESI